MSFLTLLASHVESRRKDYATGTATPFPKQPLRKDNSLRVRDTFRLIHTRRRAIVNEQGHKLRIEDLLPLLRDKTEPLRTACINAAKAARSAFAIINTQRYKRRLGSLAARNKNAEQEEIIDVAVALKNLKVALNEYRLHARFELLKPFEYLIDSTYEIDEHGHPPFSLRTLYLCLVFQSNLIWTADSLRSLLTLVLEAQRKRPESRLWWPTSLSHMVDLVLHTERNSPLDADLPPIPGVKPPKDEEHIFVHGYRE